MEPFLIGVIGVVVLFVLIFAGVHIALSMIAVGFLGLVVVLGFDMARAMMVTTIYNQATYQTLIIIPLFVFMGLLGAVSGISANIYKAVSIWMGRFRAALGIATVFSCAAFGTICGSGVTTAAVFAKVSGPEMRKQGYDKKLAYGICASAGSIGMLIPPSVVMVVWGMLTEESVGKLLIAGIGPGLLLTVLFSVGIWLIGRMKPHWVGSGSPETVTWRHRFATIKLFWPVIIISAILMGGIFLGVFSATEASAVAAVIVLVIALFTAGKERWNVVRSGLWDTTTITAMLFLILSGAMVLSRFFVVTGMSHGMLEFALSLNLTTMQFVLALVVFYVIMGCFMSGLPLIAMTVPIIYPTIIAMGIEPIWFAMVMIVSIELGGITPPVGVLCYSAKGAAEADVSLEDVFIGAIPFFFIWLIAIAVLIAFPWVSTVLPSLLK